MFIWFYWRMKKNYQKLFNLCGIIGPILISITIIILGFYQSGYNHISQYISELGARNAPNADIMNIFGFTLLGLLLIGFAYSLNLSIKNNKNSKIEYLTPIFLFIAGLMFILIAFFPCDPDCINLSTVGIIHGHISNIALFSLIFSPLFVLSRFKTNSRWKKFRIYSIVTIILGLVFSIIYKSYIFDNMTGLFQRISFGIPLFWVEIFALKRYRLFKDGP